MSADRHEDGAGPFDDEADYDEWGRFRAQGRYSEEDLLLTLALTALDTPSKSDAPRIHIDAVWRGVADGSISDEAVARWGRAVAQRLTANVIEGVASPKDRPGEALRAVGLTGRRDDAYDERRKLQLLLDFEPLVERRNRRLSSPQARRLAFMRSAGFYEGLSDRVAKKRIERLMQARPLKKTARMSRKIRTTRDK